MTVSLRNSAEKLTTIKIDATIPVNIGTTSPAYGLDVSSAAIVQARFLSTGANNAALVIDNNAGGNQSTVNFRDAGSTKWAVGKQTNNTFVLNDVTNSRDVMRVDTSDNVSLAPVAGNVLLVGGSGNVGIGTTAPQAILDVNGSGTSQSAMIVPRDSTAARPTGINGMLRYNTTSAQLETYSSGSWAGLATGGSSQWTTSGTMIYYSAGNVGIGANSADVPLYVAAPAGTPSLTTNSGVIAHFNGDYNAELVMGTDNSAPYEFYLQTKQSATNNNNIPLSINPLGGKVGIGTTNPGYTLHVVGNAGLSTGTAWTNASDVRLKDIHGDYEYGLDQILQLHTVRYSYKKDNALGIPSDHPMTGIIAQEVQKVIPDAINTRKDGYLELNIDPIHWAVVNAIKDLYKKWFDDSEGLHEEVDKLKKENTELKAYLCSKDPSAPFCTQ